MKSLEPCKFDSTIERAKLFSSCLLDATDFGLIAMPGLIQVNEQVSTEACSYCGAPNIGGYTGCRALMDRINVQFGHYRVAVDCYMLQHPEIGCFSAKSYVAHLAGLCCAMEYQESENIYAAIQRSLNGRVNIQKPIVLSSRGILTITHLQSASNLAEYKKLVREWAHSVWDAYAELHPAARSYIQAALSAKNRR